MTPQFKKVSLLGSGQGGEVWSAIDAHGTLVSLKSFIGNSRARDEYERGLSLSHPHLLKPLAFFEEAHSASMVMPYCEGRSLDNLAGFFPETLAWQLLKEMADALAYLHERGLCHGDVKPSNILWDGKAFLLADFGSCAPAGESIPAGDRSSFRFASPDRCRSAEGDIWSLGASVFNLILGTDVFNGLGGAAQRPDSPLPVLRKSMPQLSAIITKCLAYRPGDRPTAIQLRSHIDAILKDYKPQTAVRKYKNAPDHTEDDRYSRFWPDEMKDPRP